MAEPVGLLGTVVGVVSLGIQVGGALKEYLDDFRSRGEQVDKALSHLKQFKESLDAINAAIPLFENAQRVPSYRAKSCLETCRSELAILQSELEDHETTKMPKDTKGKMKEMKKKLGYPFHRKHLVELESRIYQLRGTLSLAIEALELNILSTINIRTTSLDRTTQENTVTLASLEARSDALQLEQKATNVRLAINSSTLRSVSRKVIDLDSKTTGNIEAFHSYARSSNAAHTRMLVEIQTMLQALTLEAPSASKELISRQMTNMIISKPSLLKDVHEAADSMRVEHQPKPPKYSQGTLQQSQSVPQFRRELRLVPSCGCRPHRQNTRSLICWPLVSFFDETVSEVEHQPWCPLAKASVIKGQRKIGIYATGLHRILSVAISASLSLNYGAGGYSIGPVFRCTTMVDENQSPAFRILATMRDAFYYHGTYKDDSAGDYVENLAVYATSAIRRVYENRAALPTDVSEDGSTLLQLVCQPHVIQSFGQDIFYILMKSFLDLDISWGSGTPALNLHAIFQPQNQQLEGVSHNILLALNQAVDLRWDMPSTIDYKFIGEHIVHSEDLITALGLDHPVLIALLQQDEYKLRRLFQNYSTAFIRQLIADHDWIPFSVACAWPAGLEILMETSPDFSDYIKNHSQRAIYHVLHDSRSACAHHDEWGIHNGCVYADSLAVLLNRGCHLDGEALHERFTCRPCSCCQTSLLRHIKDWREKLRSLAQTHLPEEEQRQLGVQSGNVLDADATKVMAKLEGKEIYPHKIFGLKPGDYRLSPLHDKTGSTSIYHLIFSPGAGELAFGLGFRDVNTSFHDATPLLQQTLALSSFWDYCEWLVSHGADYTSIVRLNGSDQLSSLRCHETLPKHTVGHALCHKTLASFVVSNALSGHRDGGTGPYKRLNHLLWKLEAGDECSCGCSSFSHGCTPMTTALNKYCHASAGTEGALRAIVWLSTDAADQTSSPPFAEAAIRALTFRHLGVRHTCCITVPYWGISDRYEHYGEDFDEMREEDDHLLTQLDELVSELVAELSQYGGTLESFLRGPWMSRMDEVDREARERVLTQQEIDGIKAVGVKLEDPDVEEIHDSMTYVKSYTEEGPPAQDQFEYWKTKIDEIVNGKF